MLTDVHLLKIYRAFRAIDSGAPLRVAAYFERHEEALRQLDFDRFFECQLGYCAALFACERWAEHLAATDEALENWFENDLDRWQGEDVLGDLLLAKARSHFELFQFDRAEHVLGELVKLRPAHAAGKSFWKKVKIARRPERRRASRAFALGCFLLGGLVAGGQFLVAKAFFPSLDWAFFGGWTGLLMLGFSVLLGSEAIAAARAHVAVEQFSRTRRG